MDAPVPLILVALLAAAALVIPSSRWRAAAMLGALAIAPVILIFHISGTDQFKALTDRPGLATAAGAAAAHAAAVERFGGVDILVNNAGVGFSGTLGETDFDAWLRLIHVNVDSMFHCCQAVLDGMLAQGGGTIVNMASVAGLVGLRKRVAYGTSKAAVIGFTKALAIDHAGDGLRVNCICPGTVDTPWVRRFAAEAPDPAAFRAEMEARQPVGRLGTPQEIAAAALYLASDEAAFVTGAALVIDGGLTAG
jgi:NAD(P)-dependent dehydrogenase (short-subunit alcohol dehydrogenase family)